MNISRRNARGEASLERILDATVELIGRYGYDNTTIARIVKATQRPASSIYWYFENKDDLITAALESSYSKSTRSHYPWEAFDPVRPLLEQLLEELEPELRASESEAPLRLGIMLALEGSAAASKVQEPFRRRRSGALVRIEAWWAAAFASRGGVGDIDHGGGVQWMATLTLAFLDAHYISDVVVDEQAAAHRSRILAHTLVGAFESLISSPPLLSAQDDELPATTEPADASSRGPEALLRVTRALVAEHGYEGATVSRICEAAGVQRSSVYWRYQDKDALIKAAVAEPFLELLTPFRSLPDDPDRWVEELSSALGTIMSWVRAQPDTVKAGLLLKVQRWDPPSPGGAAVLDGTHRVEAGLAEWFDRVLPQERGTEPIGAHLAWVVARLAEGLMLVSALGRPVAADAVAKLLAPMLSRALDHWPARV